MTYRDAARELSRRHAILVSAATVWKFANGHEPKSSRLRRVFGLPLTAPAPVCPVHGKVHTRRCARRTFEQNAADYDAWRQAHTGRIAEIVAWAEGRR